MKAIKKQNIIRISFLFLLPFSFSFCLKSQDVKQFEINSEGVSHLYWPFNSNNSCDNLTFKNRILNLPYTHPDHLNIIEEVIENDLDNPYDCIGGKSYTLNSVNNNDLLYQSIVVAPANCTIMFIGNISGYGNEIVLRIIDENNVFTHNAVRLAHLDRLKDGLKKGDTVHIGDEIGKFGSKDGQTYCDVYFYKDIDNSYIENQYPNSYCNENAIEGTGAEQLTYGGDFRCDICNGNSFFSDFELDAEYTDLDLGIIDYKFLCQMNSNNIVGAEIDVEKHYGVVSNFDWNNYSIYNPSISTCEFLGQNLNTRYSNDRNIATYRVIFTNDKTIDQIIGEGLTFSIRENNTAYFGDMFMNNNAATVPIGYQPQCTDFRVSLVEQEVSCSDFHFHFFIKNIGYSYIISIPEYIIITLYKSSGEIVQKLEGYQVPYASSATEKYFDIRQAFTQQLETDESYFIEITFAWVERRILEPTENNRIRYPSEGYFTCNGNGVNIIGCDHAFCPDTKPETILLTGLYNGDFSDNSQNPATTLSVSKTGTKNTTSQLKYTWYKGNNPKPIKSGKTIDVPVEDGARYTLEVSDMNGILLALSDTSLNIVEPEYCPTDDGDNGDDDNNGGGGDDNGNGSGDNSNGDDGGSGDDDGGTGYPWFPPHFPPCIGCSDWQIPIFWPFDPNEMLGPEGYGAPQWVAAKDKLYYTVLFENDPDLATSAVQRVKVAAPVDPGLDIKTFRIGQFGFARQIFDVPDDVSYYTGYLKVADSLKVDVEVLAGIDMDKREAYWIFQAVDPQTGLAPLFEGFLPVNDSAASGEGFVSFSIKPDDMAVTGDTVRATASILFDINEAIETNTWFNTLDADIPISKVDAVPDVISQDSLKITIAHHDTGSGVHDIALYVSEDEKPYKLLAYLDKENTEYLFKGTKESQYRFFSRAIDATGNAEPFKDSAETSVAFVETVLSMEYTLHHATCFNSTDAGIDLEVSGGIPPYTYLWSNDSISQDIGNIVAGSYSVTISDKTGIRLVDTFIVNQPDPVFIDLGNDILLLKGEQTVLKATPGYVSYLWNDGSTKDSLVVGDGLDTLEYSFSVTVTDSNGCKNADTVQVLVYEPSDILELSSDTWIKFFPNPTKDILYLQIRNDTNEEIEVMLNDMTGKLVFHGLFPGIHGINLKQIDLTGCDKGSYLITIQKGNNLLSGNIVVY